MIILNFHGIGLPTRALWPREEDFWVKRSLFLDILDLIQGRGDVLVTFDDANVSDFDVALPALQARGIKAEFFLVSDFIGKRGFLSEGQVKELAAAGMVIGNHGKLHKCWRGLAEDELLKETAAARDRLENIISKQIKFAACPNGSYDKRVLDHLREHGYERVYTSDRGFASPTAWLQPRNSIVRSDDLHRIKKILSCRAASPHGIWLLAKRCLKCWR